MGEKNDQRVGLIRGDKKMKKTLVSFVAVLALSATAAFAQDRRATDEGDTTARGTRAAAFVVVRATDGTHSVYKIPAEAVDIQNETERQAAIVAAATESNRIRANIAQDEGDIDASRPAWFFFVNTFNFGWYGGYGGYNPYSYGYGYGSAFNWYRPVYSWYTPYYNYWAYRWYW
jgi:hypothetical protein